MPPIIIAAGIVATASVGTGMYQSAQEKKQQKKTLNFQEEQVRKAEAAAANADILAAQAAKDKIKKQRLMQTNTILTSPLGIQDEAGTLKSVLGG